VDAALLVAGREEFGIAHQVIEICAAASGGARITRVVLEIGKLSAVLPDAVRFCFDAATEGTLAEGAELEIIEVPGVVRCEDCGREMTRDRRVGHCACGGSSFESLAGDELRIKAMEVKSTARSESLMKRAHTMIATVAALGVLALAWTAAAQQGAPTNTKVQRSDRNFIEKAAGGGKEEVELGRLAQSKASNEAVKQFAQRMVEDHANANKELMELAANKGVKLDDKAPKKNPMMDRLSKLQGADFDREYVKEMVKDHKKDVAEFRRMHSGAVDPNLKAWIDKTLPTLEDHLKTIEGIQSQIASAKK
jgi:putative membrane protein